MLINVVKYVRGYIRVRITGHSPERFINLCSNKNILIWDLTPHENDYEFNISRNSFKELGAIVKKTKTKVQIIDKIGLPFFMFRHRKRKLFFLGMVLCIAMIYVMSLFVWDIRVNGTYTYTKEDILSYVENNFIHPGSLKSSVDCAGLEEKLREQYEGIAWVSCELVGTQLIIKVKETLDIGGTETLKQPCDVIASKDGTIKKIITRNGTPVVKNNDKVKKGDVLISSTIHIYDDNQEVLETDYVPAQGDVLAETTYNYLDTFDMNYYDKVQSGKSKTYVTFLLFGNPYTPYKQKNRFAHSDLIQETIQLKLGQTFYLPFSLQKNTMREYTPTRKTYSKKEAEAKINAKLKKFNESLLEKGVEIVENNVKISIDGEKCTAKGKITVIEPIGKFKPIDKKELEQEEQREQEDILEKEIQTNDITDNNGGIQQ